MNKLQPLVIALLVLGYVWGAFSAWSDLHGTGYAKDNASYYYATQALNAGENPYEPTALETLAQQDGFTSDVYPYLYPPPFLVGMTWARPLGYASTVAILFAIHHVCVLVFGVILRRWLGTPILLITGVLATCTPLIHTARVGQVNAIVLMLIAFGLWRHRGTSIAMAAMIKMSPAILLGGWAIQRKWRPIRAAIIAAIVLTLGALLVVPIEVQKHFYLTVLPGFSSGAYNGLQVAITLPANHSIPNVLAQLWPGPDAHTLSTTAQRLSSVISLGLIGGTLIWMRDSRSPLTDACLFGALIVGMVVSPIFAYEHHFAFLTLPVIGLGTALNKIRPAVWVWGLYLFAYAGIAWPLPMFRRALRMLPEWSWAIQETKLLGALIIGGMCLWAARRAELES